MQQNQLDIIDREDRVFKSFQAAIDLMACSQSEEVQNAQALLDFLAEEYQKCRVAMRQSINQMRAIE